MKTPLDILEIYLQPGEFYFGDEKTRIRTLLGSCVAVTMWHPKLNIGGMCHYMLPHNRRAAAKTKASGRERRGAVTRTDVLDGHYAVDAMQMFLREIHLARTLPTDYQVKLFGGGQMFAAYGKSKGAANISEQNVAFAHTLIEQYGFKLKAQDLGGEGHRNIIFDLWSGDVWVRAAKNLAPDL